LWRVQEGRIVSRWLLRSSDPSPGAQRCPHFPMVQRFRRRRKLIRPGLQLRLSAKFLGLVVLMLSLQYTLLDSLLHRAASRMPADSGWSAEEASSIGIELLGWSALIFLPLTFLVGVVGSFRFAGPLYRFDQFLKAVIAGDRPNDIRLRAGDELQDLADLMNEATRSLRSEDIQSEVSVKGQDPPRRAAA